MAKQKEKCHSVSALIEADIFLLSLILGRELVIGWCLDPPKKFCIIEF